MHGYQIMQSIEERTSGAWKPSPGAVYPTINLLEDEGLVTTSEEGGRRLVSLTDAGRIHLSEHADRLGDPFAQFEGRGDRPDVRHALRELQGATRQIVMNGDEEQITKAEKVLAEARRALYLTLAGEAPTGDGE